MKRVPLLVLFVGVSFCWGMNSVAMRYAARFGPSLTIATARAVLGALLLIGLARFKGARWPEGRDEWVGIVAIGINMTGLSTAFIFLGARHLPAGLVSIFSNTLPLFTALLAVALLGDRLRSVTVVGLLIGLVGAVIVGWRALDGEIDGWGVVFGLAGAFFGAVGSVLYKRHPLPNLDRVMGVGCQLAVSSVLLAAMSIPDDRSTIRFAPMLWVDLAYLACFGLALSFVMYSELLSRAPATFSGSVAYLSTVFGVALGWLLLDEHLSALVMLGGLVTVLGVAIVQVPQLRTSGRAS